MRKKLPLYQLTIDPEKNSFVSAISLVNSPAVESSFLAFSDDMKKEPFKEFSFSDDDQMELIGIAMKADTPIYRIDNEGEYLVTFSKKDIRKIAQTYFKMDLAKSNNIEHSDLDADSITYQSWIIDDARGVKAPYGIDAKDGDWLIGMKVESAEHWKKVKSGEVTGFSIEGIFKHYKVDGLVDFEFNSLQPSESTQTFIYDLELELDEILKRYNLN